MCRDAMQTNTGINWNPLGILADEYLWNNVLSGPDCYIRDGMHTVSSNGVGGTEIALIIQELKSINIGIDIVQKFSKLWILPTSQGKVTDMYFKEELVQTDHVRHFASQVLTMIHLLHAFLQEKIKPTGRLTDHIACFGWLYEIITICRLGIGGINGLRHAVFEHANLYKRLYDIEHIKIKWHHLMHLPDDLQRIGRMVACFVTERKHLDVRECSDNVFRHIEHTVVHDILNNLHQNYMGNSSNFMPKFLLDPEDVVSGGEQYFRSYSATFECGTLHRNDIVILRDRSVAQALEFWQRPDGDFAVRVQSFVPLDSNTWQRCIDSEFVAANDIVEAVPYYVPRQGQVRIAPLACAFDTI
jgi:hypothetical protein